MSFGALAWPAFVAMVIFHAWVTYIGLLVFGEDDLTQPIDFIYFYFTSASTVGYGDLSPQTDGGRIFATIWLFPGALIFFTVYLTKLTQIISNGWRKRMDGLADYSKRTGATVLIGYDPVRTPRMLQEIIAGGVDGEDVIIVSAKDVQIDKARIRYVRAQALSNRADLLRAGVAQASKVVVYADTDEISFAAAMAVSAMNPNAHLVVYFNSDDKAEILSAHTRATCVISPSAELVVREMQDPGVAALVTDLSSARSSVAVFSLACPATGHTAGQAFAAFRALGATFLGTRNDAQTDPMFNLPDATPLDGQVLYYIADARIAPQDFSRALAQI
ncbi:MAG: potassium channel family protein [Paracoccaceae bacterium]